MENRSRQHAAIQPRPTGSDIPLTAMQQRVWRSRSDKSRWTSIRFCTTTVRIIGELDPEILRRSIETTIHRHESLRTRLAEVNGVPLQLVAEPSEFQLELVDLSTVPTANGEQQARKLMEAFAQEKIDLFAAPLFAAKLFRFSSHDHVLICALDHMISDGVSLGILDREIWTLYRHGVHGLPPPLPPLQLHFGDYARWQQDTYDSWVKQHLPYWKERLAGTPSVRLPRSADVPTPNDPKGALLQLSFEPSLSDGLRDFAKRERTLLPLVMLTVHFAVLSRWCHQQDLLLLFASNARYRKELHTMIGFLASALHLRVKVADDDTYASLLSQVTREFYQALSHEELGRVSAYFPEWGIQPTEARFNWLPVYEARQPFDYGQRQDDEFQLQPFSFRTAITEPFLLLFSESADAIVATVNYLPHLFTPSSVNRFLANVRDFTADFIRNPSAPIRQYS